jgi:sec-independent protein translocase protein TatA
MFGRLGPLEIGIILVIVLLLFGASRLPQLGASVGKTVREFRKGMREATEEIAEATKAEPPSQAASGTSKANGAKNPVEHS